MRKEYKYNMCEEYGEEMATPSDLCTISVVSKINQLKQHPCGMLLIGTHVFHLNFNTSFPTSCGFEPYSLYGFAKNRHLSILYSLCLPFA